MEESTTFTEHPTTCASLSEPVRDALRVVPIGDLRRPRHRPASARLRRSRALALASIVLIAIGTVIFKRLEPMYAKVL